MLLPRLAFGCLLLGSPILSLAQTADPVPVPKFYVGLGAYGSSYQKLGGRPNSGATVPVQLTVGYQLLPRLAVQVGLAYSGYSDSYAYDGRIYSDPIIPSTYFADNGKYTERNFSASVLARYTLTRKPAHRMQFDLLGGFGLESPHSRSQGTRSDSVQSSLVATPYTYRFSKNDLLFTLGLSTRYRLSQRFELTYDFTISSVVASDKTYPISRLTGANALGLRYRFGQR